MEEESPISGKDLFIKVTRKGKSVFAGRSFRKGEFVIEFRGKRYTKEEYLRKVNPKNNHFLQIDTHLFLGPTRTPDNYINHSCDPNTGLTIVDGRVLLHALREILPGEELSFDYSTTMAEDFWEMDCSCGAPGCRGRVRDFKHLPRNVIDRYIELGIVPDFVLASLGPDPVMKDHFDSAGAEMLVHGNRNRQYHPRFGRVSNASGQ